ncbi:MAG: hypothetical protein BAJALOKI1v1_1610001, partial [Promethearchaeota archaeon]
MLWVRFSALYITKVTDPFLLNTSHTIHEYRKRPLQGEENVQLTQKIRIYPTVDQLELLWDLSEKCRLIYNFALSDRL